jgi:hypothetical protein
MDGRIVSCGAMRGGGNLDWRREISLPIER